jgi:hypothetical protein
MGDKAGGERVTKSVTVIDMGYVGIPVRGAAGRRGWAPGHRGSAQVRALWMEDRVPERGSESFRGT